MPATLVLFESPQRLAEMLADAAAVLGGAPGRGRRELTKLHEEHRRGTLAELAAHYAAPARPRASRRGDRPPAGGAPMRRTMPRSTELLRTALRTEKPRVAAAEVAAATGRSRQRALPPGPGAGARAA